MYNKTIYVTITDPNYEPEEGTPFDAVMAALEFHEIPAYVVEKSADRVDKHDVVAAAVLAACKRQVEKGRSLDNVNLDAIVKQVLKGKQPDNRLVQSMPVGDSAHQDGHLTSWHTQGAKK